MDATKEYLKMFTDKKKNCVIIIYQRNMDCNIGMLCVRFVWIFVVWSIICAILSNAGSIGTW